ncbi:MAG: TetR/AcrR family transcriptional regulator [Pseudoflavonifractor sp.]
MDYNERRQVQSQQTEQAILQSALVLARESSFEGITVREICAHAGITTGAFYHHFPSKEALLQRGFTPLDSYMEQHMAGHEDAPPAERLWLLLSGYAKFFEEDGPRLVGRYYEHRLSSGASAPLDPTRYTHRAMLDCLREAQKEGVLAPGRTPEWVADFLFRHFRGVVIDWVLHDGSYRLHDKLEQDYDFFQHVLKTDESAQTNSCIGEAPLP